MEVKEFSLEVNLFRGKYWIDYLVINNRCKGIPELFEKISLTNDLTGLYAYQRITTSTTKNKQFVTIPKADKILFAESTNEGSLAAWLNGPSKLPFWDVLNGDVRVSEEVFYKVLGSGLKGGSWLEKSNAPLYEMNYIQKVTAFFQELLPKELWKVEIERISKYGRLGNFEKEVSSVKIMDIINGDENQLDILFDTEDKEMILNKAQNILSNEVFMGLTELATPKLGDKKGTVYLPYPEKGDPVDLYPYFSIHNPDIVLALISLMVISKNSNNINKNKINDYIKVGLKKPIKHIFNMDSEHNIGDDVYQYVLDNF